MVAPACGAISGRRLLRWSLLHGVKGIRLLRRGCRRWKPFIWEEAAGGSAYNFTIASLRKRLGSRLAGFATARKRSA